MQGAAAAVFTPLTMMTVASSSESLLNCHVLRRNLEEKLPYIETALHSYNLKVRHALGVSKIRNKI
jgi:hypothetical protein